MSDKQVFMGDDFAIEIDLGRDLTSGTGPKILFKKPDGTPGSWDATADGTKLVYNVTHGEIDMPGLWQFSGRIKLDSKKLTSDVVTQLIDKPLDV